MITDLHTVRTHLAPLLEGAFEGTWVVALDGTTVWANRQARSIVGLELDELLALPLESLVHPEDRPRMHEALSRRSEGHGERYELRLRHSGGEYRTVQVSTSPLRDETGAVWAGLGFVRDITDALREREELARTSEKLGALLQHAPAAVIVLDDHGLVEFWNEQAERIFGWSAPEVLGKPPPFVRPEDRESFQRLHAAGLGGVGLRQQVIRRQKKGGEEITLSISTAPLSARASRGAKVMGIILDVSEVEASREALARLNEDLEAEVRRRTAHLEQVNAEMRLLTSGISHDLRTPVRAIQGFTASVVGDEENLLSPRSAADLLRVLEATEALEAQLEGLMALARTNRSRFQPVEVDLGALAHRVHRQLGLDRSWAGRFDVGPLPAVVADVELAQLLLTNLLSNAAKYSARVDAPRIVVEGRELPGGWVEISVGDNGVGFDPRHADKLFQPFSRLHHAREFPGSGLGLAICRRVVDRHGGEIRAHASPGAGATFTFTLESSR